MIEHELMTREKRSIWMEIGVVVAIGVLPHMLRVVYGWANPEEREPPSNAAYFLYAVGMNMPIVLPLLWIMARSGRAWEYFGIAKLRWRVDVCFAPMVALIILASHYVGGMIIWYGASRSTWAYELLTSIKPDEGAMESISRQPSSAGAWIALTVYLLVNGLAEELVLRGYLLVRLREVTGNPFVAVALVSGLGAAYHLYQGSHAAADIFLGQAVVCALYLKVPRVLPFALGHALYDLAISVWYTGQ